MGTREVGDATQLGTEVSPGRGDPGTARRSWRELGRGLPQPPRSLRRRPPGGRLQRSRRRARGSARATRRAAAVWRGPDRPLGPSYDRRSPLGPLVEDVHVLTVDVRLAPGSAGDLAKDAGVLEP